MGLRRDLSRQGEAGYSPLPFEGRPNTEGTPEQLDANLHALTLRKLETLRQEARNIRR